MSHTAFVFPGQGAQYSGMGKDFYEKESKSREIFDQASDVCGLDIKGLCFEEHEDLHKTEYTQIAMLTTCMAITEAVRKKGLEPEVTAGLSLGEYSALAASDVVAKEDLYRIVRKRGILMQDAVPEGGAMSAVLGTETSLIEAVCEETEGIVSIANYNCPGQIVITGQEAAVKHAGDILKARGVRRIIPLKVSGPFHSPMLTGAGQQLGKALEEVEIREFQIPYVSNVHAGYVRDRKAVKALLTQQVSAPVRWQQCVEAMIQEGVDTFVEIGPGKTLSAFMRKINRNVETINIERTEDLAKIERLL